MIQRITHQLNHAFLAVLLVVSVQAQAAQVNCHPLQVTSCALPFPSNLFTDPNDSAATGIAIDYPDTVLNGSVTDEMLPSFLPNVAFGNSTGFSASTPIYFELAEAISPDSLPTDGGNSFVVFDLGPTSLSDPNYQGDLNARGRQVDIVTYVSKTAQQDNVAVTSHVLEAWPRSRYEYGHRYVAAITTALRDQSQGNIPSAPGLQNTINNPSAIDLDIFELLESKGFSRDNLISFTYFTVRPQSEVMTPMTSMMETTYNQDHPIRNLAITLNDETSFTLNGEVRVTSFRDNNGGVVYNPLSIGASEWIPFLLTIPKNSGLSKLPIAIWGHGGFTAKEVRHPLLQNNSLGIATISIDYPNHGARIAVNGDDGKGYIADSLEPTDLQQQMGMIIQAPIDQMSLLKAIHTELDTALDDLRQLGNAIPDLDTDNIVIQGISLGAMAGSTFGAFAPGIKGVFLENGGNPTIHLLTRSLLWDLGARDMMPDTATGAEISFIAGMMHHYADIGESTNFAHLYRNPLEGLNVRPLAYIYSLGDGVTVNATTQAVAEIAGLPLVNDVLEPRPQFGAGIDGFDPQGFGLMQNNYGTDDLTLAIGDLQSVINTSESIGAETRFSEIIDFLPDGLDITFLNTFIENPEQYPLLNDFLDDFFLGQAEDFATHFNSNNSRALKFERQWLCERLTVNQDACTTQDNTDTSTSSDSNTRTLYPGPSGGSIPFIMLAVVLALLPLYRSSKHHA